MSELIVTERENIVAIADAVRSQTGTTEEMTLGEIVSGINSIGGSDVVVDATLTQEGKAADAKAVGDVLNTKVNNSGWNANKYIGTDENGNIVEKANGLTTAQITALDNMFKVCAFIKEDVTAEYFAFHTAFGLVTLSSISATYSGGDVFIGTTLADLEGIVVTAEYSDGSTKTVTDYTITGNIVEGDNIITVGYNDMTTTFIVVGVVFVLPEDSNWTVLTIPKSELSNIGLGQLAGNNYSYASSTRQSFLQFIPVVAGATYQFDWISPSPTLQVCIEAYPVIAMEKVANREDYSGSERYSSGWASTQVTGCSFTIPETHAGSEVVAMRFTFNAPGGVTGNVTITKVVA